MESQADKNWKKRAQDLFYETDLEAFQDLYQDHSLIEIGKLMKISDGAVNQRMKRYLKMPMKPSGGNNYIRPPKRKEKCKYYDCDRPRGKNNRYYCNICQNALAKIYENIEERGYI